MEKFNSYEVLFIVDAALSEEAIKALVEKFKSLIEANGTIDSIDDWGKRKLAYAIEDETEGYYVLYTFTCKPDFPAELERIVKITDGVLRSLVIAK